MTLTIFGIKSFGIPPLTDTHLGALHVCCVCKRWFCCQCVCARARTQTIYRIRLFYLSLFIICFLLSNFEFFGSCLCCCCWVLSCFHTHNNNNWDFINIDIEKFWRFINDEANIIKSIALQQLQLQLQHSIQKTMMTTEEKTSSNKENNSKTTQQMNGIFTSFWRQQ